LKDEGSTNGTYVNERRLSEPHPLDDGDTVKIGRTVLKYTESPVEVQYLEHVMGLAQKDALTGLFNKRRFDELLPAEATRSTQGGTPLSLVLFDIDHFKAVNDSHGHAAGDAVLQRLPEVAAPGLRAFDVFGRLGGEEFLVVLPGTELAGAVVVAERVRAAVEAASFAGLPEATRVTVTLGVAQRARGEDVSALLARADRALYAGKAAGRNRVETDPPPKG
jgi:diguanylate cyclase (GGDEF)-like protein